ncbi:MAG: hypothetical protein EOP50_07985, partial [Sphingobacteriales bacterium]
MNKKELWLRLRGYNFNHLVPTSLWDDIRARFGGPDAATRAFADKLARKLGWKHRFACRAVLEYKKYVYLGVISDFVVTSSRVIDQVWHEHLLFSRGYRSFCNEVIGRPFEHEPELMPAENQTVIFRAQYADTLELYRAEFGYEPPADIWYDAKFDNGENTGKSSRKQKATNTSDPGSVDYYYHSAPLYSFFESDSSQLAFDGGDGGGAGASGDSSDSSDSGAGDSGSDASCSSCSSG